MENKNIYNKIYEKKCAVCGHKYMADVYDQGECSHCGWFNGKIYCEFPDKVVYSNLISLNKAKQLYKEGKPFEPNLDEFIEALLCYSEMRFEYKGNYYGVEIKNNNKDGIEIQLYNSRTGEDFLFKTKEDFKNNAKVGDKYLKDVWEETTDRYWL